jgi:hypothetical protein
MESLEEKDARRYPLSRPFTIEPLTAKEILTKLEEEYKSCLYWSQSKTLTPMQREKFAHTAKMLDQILDYFTW